MVRPSRSLFSPPRLSPLKLQLTGLPVVAGLLVVGKLADLGFSLVAIVEALVGLAVGGLVGAGVVIFLRKVGRRVTTTWVGAALGLGVGLFGAAGGGLVGVLAGGRLEATFGKAVKGVTTTEVGRGPGRGVGLPKLVLLLSKVPPDERLGKVFCPSPN